MNEPVKQPIRIVAVIDIGATALRMAVAEIHPGRTVKVVDTLSQGIAIGQDTFRDREISHETIGRVIRVLKQYQRVLEEYAIVPEDVRIVATSAVREAANRDLFIDRVSVITGLEVRVIDEPEVIRLTYMGIRTLLDAHPELLETSSLVTEIGGGVTKLLMMKGGEVLSSLSTRLGGLRLREMFENYGVEDNRVGKLIRQPISKSVGRIMKYFGDHRPDSLIALGGDIRFAANQLLHDQADEDLVVLEVSSVKNLAEEIMDHSIEDIARRYRLPMADAEILGPTLLAYVELARVYGLEKIHAARVTLRSGLLMEMASDEGWSGETEQQIINSAMNLARKYDVDLKDGAFVAEMSVRLFDGLQPLHGLSRRHRLILYLGALLHEIGLFVSGQSHHKHALYILSNSSIFGLGRRDMLLVGLVARYHRRAFPRMAHEGYASLNMRDRSAVAKMAAVLRLADAMERSRLKEIDQVNVRFDDETASILVPSMADLSMEQYNLRQKSQLFEEVFGLKVNMQVQPAPSRYQP